MYHPSLKDADAQEEARRQDAEFRRRQVAGMTKGQTQEALLTLLETLKDQMPDMTAEGGYWYTLGYLEATLGSQKQEASHG